MPNARDPTLCTLRRILPRLRAPHIELLLMIHLGKNIIMPIAVVLAILRLSVWRFFSSLGACKIIPARPLTSQLRQSRCRRNASSRLPRRARLTCTARAQRHCRSHRLHQGRRLHRLRRRLRVRSGSRAKREMRPQRRFIGWTTWRRGQILICPRPLRAWSVMISGVGCGPTKGWRRRLYRRRRPAPRHPHLG